MSLSSFVYRRVKQRRYGSLLGIGLVCLLAISFVCKHIISVGYFNDIEPSSSFDSEDTLTPVFDVSKRIAYISRHSGTTVDFKYMAEHLQLENVDYYDASEAFEVFAPAKDYREQVTSGEVEKFCMTYDAIFISDKLADGWPFIMDGEQPCQNIFFIVTNRFDVAAPEGDGYDAYIKDFNHSLNRDDEYRAKIIVNNAFEVPYMIDRGVDNPDYQPLIRPFGFNSVSAQKVNVEDNEVPCMIIGRVDQDKILMNDLVRQYTNHECKVFKKHYGGPRTLSLYQSIVVHLPYQVSIMKMWENLAYGVLMAVPSPEFFNKICAENKCTEVKDAFETKKVVGEEIWYKYLDFYLPEWEKCFIKFDSWEELDTILTEKKYMQNINHCRDKMEDLRELGLQSWKEVLLNLQ